MKRLPAIYFFLLISNYALPQPGSPDNSFGANGKVVIPVGASGDIANGMAVQADGKIIVAGHSCTGNCVGSNFDQLDFSVVRLNTDGTLDNSFDGDGKVMIPLTPYSDRCFAIAIRPDGKIILGGTAATLGVDNNFAFARLNADGSLDNSFDGDGIAIINLATQDFCTSLALQSDGKIVATGYSLNGGNYDFTIMRLNANGSLDNSFDADGVTMIPVGSGPDYSFAVTLQTDGKIIVAGTTSNATDEAAVVRLNSNGSLDNSFDVDGKLIISANGGYEYLRSVLLQNDGKILLAGWGSLPNQSQTDCIVYRLNSNGSLDNSFDGDGKAIIPVAGNLDDKAYAMTLQSNGKIVIAGEAFNFISNNNNFYAARLNSNGSPDTAFDGDGMVILTASSLEKARALSLQTDGKILLAGFQGSDFTEDFAVYRLMGDSISCPDQDNDGYTVCQGDCNDNNANIHPGATEVCNGVDDDCDGLIDEGVLLTFYRDLDGDNYGNPAVTTQACSAPAGFVNNNTDCNDNDANIHPGATEVCNGVDDDCDGLVDEDCNAPYRGGFGDGHDTARLETQVLGPPAYFTPYFGGNGDGHDTARLETLIFGPPLYFTPYFGGAGDGHDSARLKMQTLGPPAYFTPYFGGTGDGHAMSLGTCNMTTYYRDADGDGYGNNAIIIQSCTQPSGYVINNTDCNDNNANIHPGAIEICGNNIDDNCNGQVDENTMTAAISPSGSVNICLGTALILTSSSGAGFTYQWFRNNLLIAGQNGITLSVTLPGSYTVRVTNSGNCSAISAATVANLTNPPVAGISITGNGNNCPVNMLAHPGGPGVTYQWDKNGIAIGGATSRNYSANTSGDYSVKITKDGCSATSAPVVVSSCPQSAARQDITLSLKVDEMPEANTFSVKAMPNPSSNDFTLRIQTSSKEMLFITVYDAAGRLVKLIQSVPDIPIRLGSNWMQGVYMAEIRQGKNRQSLKLVKL